MLIARISGRNVLFSPFLLCCSPPCPALASPWAEVGDNQLRVPTSALLAAAGVIEDVTTHWPLPWNAIVDDLEVAQCRWSPSACRGARRGTARHGARAGRQQGRRPQCLAVSGRHQSATAWCMALTAWDAATARPRSRCPTVPKTLRRGCRWAAFQPDLPEARPHPFHAG